jgi:uncharacterized membrane protein
VTDSQEPTISRGRALWYGFQKNLLAGLVLLLPLLITLVVLTWLYNLVSGPASGLLLNAIPEELRERTMIKQAVKLGVVVLFALSIFLLGTLTRHVLGKRLFNAAEGVMLSVPGVSRIYSAVKQIIEAFTSNKKIFRRVVLVTFPVPGTYVIGFLTADSSEEINRRLNRKYVNVFLPTTPNPTSGYMLVVPADEVVPLDMSVEEGIKMVVSAGVVSPPWKLPPRVSELK